MQFKVSNPNGLHIRSKAATDNTSQVVGHFAEGEIFDTVEVFSNSRKQIWGRLTKAYERNQEYVLIQDQGTINADPTPVQPLPEQAALTLWAIQIDQWARTQGFDGIKPTGL